MFANEKAYAVARILAVTVLLDEEQRCQEMVEFCHYVMTINQDICNVSILPRTKILDWFEAHKADFAKSLAQDADDSFKTEILECITETDLQKQVLTAIFAISISDYEFRDEEAQFIQLALRLWKSDMPSVSVVDRMAG